MTNTNTENVAPGHLCDPSKARLISRTEWDFHKEVVAEQEKRGQYPGFIVLESDNQRGH